MNQPFLMVPPFPGARGLPLTATGSSSFDGPKVLAALVAARVGGRFWLAAAELQPGHEIILVPDSPAQLAAMIRALPAPQATVLGRAGGRVPAGFMALGQDFDPWHLAAQAREVWTGSNRELAKVAALLGKPVRVYAGEQVLDPQPDLIATLLAELAANRYASPFDGEPWDIEQAITQLGAWRSLIESNRAFQAIVGVARWKRVTVDPLLWDGTGPVRHLGRGTDRLVADRPVAAWKSRTPQAVLDRLGSAGISIAELEDGFIRSVGLGANCVPPLSIFLDRSGVYFDPNQPSDLEKLLEFEELPEYWIYRAGEIRAALVQSGISKYGREQVCTPPAPTSRRQVLVTGQVEDDRSVLSGGHNCTNLELIARTRALEPDAWIIYKPHPDVEAGHRKGHVPDHEVLRHADAIDRESSIASLIARVDALHVITSLAGFEALLRGKQVTAHGQPFYAGWGLTRDLAPANPRRTRHRSLDELVAAALIGYPRYVDPVTRLPCSPELLINRIAVGQARVRSLLITLREWQGRAQLAWRRLLGDRR